MIDRIIGHGVGTFVIVELNRCCFQCIHVNGVNDAFFGISGVDLAQIEGIHHTCNLWNVDACNELILFSIEDNNMPIEFEIDCGVELGGEGGMSKY